MILSPTISPFKIALDLFLFEWYVIFVFLIEAIRLSFCKKLNLLFDISIGVKLNFFSKIAVYFLIFSKSKFILDFFNSIFLKLCFFLFNKL